MSLAVVGQGTCLTSHQPILIGSLDRKTTTMLFKMLAQEHFWQQSHGQSRDLMPTRPRQLFVTQSRVLADKVEEHFTKLLHSLRLSSNITMNISTLLERKKSREETLLVDRDEVDQWRSDLPKKFSDLTDDHFPLFLTFDKVC
jgi:hypothetical protein